MQAFDGTPGALWSARDVYIRALKLDPGFTLLDRETTAISQMLDGLVEDRRLKQVEPDGSATDDLFYVPRSLGDPAEDERAKVEVGESGCGRLPGERPKEAWILDALAECGALMSAPALYMAGVSKNNLDLLQEQGHKARPMADRMWNLKSVRTAMRVLEREGAVVSEGECWRITAEVAMPAEAQVLRALGEKFGSSLSAADVYARALGPAEHVVHTPALAIEKMGKMLRRLYGEDRVGRLESLDPYGDVAEEFYALTPLPPFEEEGRAKRSREAAAAHIADVEQAERENGVLDSVSRLSAGSDDDRGCEPASLDHIRPVGGNCGGLVPKYCGSSVISRRNRIRLSSRAADCNPGGFSRGHVLEALLESSSTLKVRQVYLACTGGEEGDGYMPLWARRQIRQFLQELAEDRRVVRLGAHWRPLHDEESGPCGLAMPTAREVLHTLSYGFDSPMNVREVYSRTVRVEGRPVSMSPKARKKMYEILHSLLDQGLVTQVGSQWTAGYMGVCCGAPKPDEERVLMALQKECGASLCVEDVYVRACPGAVRMPGCMDERMDRILCRLVEKGDVAKTAVRNEESEIYTDLIEKYFARKDPDRFRRRGTWSLRGGKRGRAGLCSDDSTPMGVVTPGAGVEGFSKEQVLEVLSRYDVSLKVWQLYWMSRNQIPGREKMPMWAGSQIGVLLRELEREGKAVRETETRGASWRAVRVDVG
jgi:hypothetical protein